jgi:uncharacterized protein (DUF1778 family)
MSNCVIGVRVTPEDKELLGRVSKARGEDISDFVRRAFRKELASLSYLSDADKKALGVPCAVR